MHVTTAMWLVLAAVAAGTARAYPVGPVCTAGDNEITVSWNEETSVGQYWLVASSTGLLSTRRHVAVPSLGPFSVTLTGLRNGYAFDVAVGAEEPSACTGVVPFAVQTLQNGDVDDPWDPSAPTSSTLYKHGKLALGDINADTYVDLVVGQHVQDGLIHYGSAQGLDDQFSVFSPLPAAGHTAPTIADLDGDGLNDVAWGIHVFNTLGCSPAGSNVCPMSWAKNTGSGFNAAQTLLTDLAWAQSGVSYTPGFGDFDGDGDLDLVVGVLKSANTAYAQYVPNSGTAEVGVWEWADGYDITGSAAAGFSQANAAIHPSACDIDSDGDLDLLFADSVSSTFLRNNGNSTVPAFSDTLEILPANTGFSGKVFFSAECLDGYGILSLQAGNINSDAVEYLGFAPFGFHPEAPRTVTATSDYGSLTVDWTYPEDDGGSPVTSFSLYLDGAQVATPSGTNTSATLTQPELELGRVYNVTLSSTNVFGTSITSEDVLITAEAWGYPSEPLDLACEGLDYAVAATWSPPLFASTIDFYSYSVNGAVATVGPGVTSLDLSALPNYVSVELIVAAESNTFGAGPAVSCTVTPRPPSTLVLGDVEHTWAEPQLCGGTGQECFVLPQLVDYEHDGAPDLVYTRFVEDGDTNALAWLASSAADVQTSVASHSYVQPAVSASDMLLLTHATEESIRWLPLADAILGDFDSESLGADLDGLLTGSRPGIAMTDQDELVVAYNIGTLDHFLAVCPNFTDPVVGSCVLLSNVTLPAPSTTNIIEFDNWMPSACTLNGAEYIIISDGNSSHFVVRDGLAGTLLEEPPLTLAAGYVSCRTDVGIAVVTAADGAEDPFVAVSEWWVFATHPEAAVGVDVRADPEHIEVSWTPPTRDGGLPLSYLVTTRWNETGAVINTTVVTSPLAQLGRNHGLTTGNYYDFDVVAFNAIGSSPVASTTAVTALVDVPTLPSALRCEAGDYAATLYWEEPQFGAGSVTGYSCSPPGVALDSSTLNVTVTGLDNYEPVQFSVVAINDAGESEPATCWVTPSSPRRMELSSVEALNADALSPWSLGINYDDLLWNQEFDRPVFEYLGEGPFVVTQRVGFDQALLTTELADEGNLKTLNTWPGCYLARALDTNDSIICAGEDGTLNFFQFSETPVDVLSVTLDETITWGAVWPALVESVLLVSNGSDIWECANNGASCSLLLDLNYSSANVGAVIDGCDFDADGDDDLFVGINDGTVLMFENVLGEFGSEDATLVFSAAGDNKDVAPSCLDGFGLMVSDDTSLAAWIRFVGHPEPPTNASAVAAVGAAQLRWSAPVSDGGAPIESYNITNNVTEDTVVVAASSRSATVTGLAAGVAYGFSVFAVTSEGRSPTAAVVSATPPELFLETAPLSGGLAVFWNALDTDEVITISADTVTATVPIASGGVNLTGLAGCEIYTVNASGVITAQVDAASPPLGVCPRTCPSSISSPTWRWLDPTQLDVFEVLCLEDAYAVLSSGNSTLVAGGALSSGDPEVAFTSYSLPVERKRALSRQASVSRVEFFGDNNPRELEAALLPELGYASRSLASGSGDYLITDTGSSSSYGDLVAFVDGEFVVNNCAEYYCNNDNEALPNMRLSVAYASNLRTTIGNTPATHTPESIDVSTFDFGFEVNVADAVIKVSVDSNDSFVEPQFASYDQEAQGEHTMTVRADLNDGEILEADPATLTWNLDSINPIVDVAPPPDYSRDQEATFGLSLQGEVYCLFNMTVCSDDGPCFTVEPSPLFDDADGAATADTFIDERPASPLYSYQSQFLVQLSSVQGAAVQYQGAVDGGEWAEYADSATVLWPDAGWHSYHFRAVADADTMDREPPGFAVEVIHDELTDDKDAPDTLLAADPPSVVLLGDESHVVSVNASEDDCAFEYSSDSGASWVEANSSEIPLRPVDAVGINLLAVRAQDLAGNIDPTPLVVAWQVIDAAPVATLELVPLAMSTIPTAIFAVRVTGGSDCSATYVVTSSTLDFEETGSAAADGSIVLENALSYGDFEIEVTPRCEITGEPATYRWQVVSSSEDLTQVVDTGGEGVFEARISCADKAGNESPLQTFTWAVDTTPPRLAVHSGSAYTATAAFTFGVGCNEQGCTYNVSSTAGSVVTVEAVNSTASQVTVSGLGEGGHEVTVAALDGALNPSPWSEPLSFTVDSQPPVLSVVSTTALLAPAPAFNVSCTDATTECSVALWLNDTEVESAAPVAAPADGRYTLRVVGTDLAGNAAEAQVSLEVDTTPPTTWATGVPSATNNRTIALVAHCNDTAGHGCALLTTPGGIESASGETVLVRADADGVLAISVVATDAAGNADPAPQEFEVVIDATPPVVSAVGEPAYWPDGLTASVRVECLNESAPCSFQFESTTATVEPGLNGSATVLGTADGDVAVLVTAEDEATNVSPEALQLSLRFDATAPVVNVTQRPPAATSLPSPQTLRFAVVEANGFSCNCSSGACSPDADIDVSTATADGEEEAVEFSISCVDERGNVGAASAAWVVDRRAPSLSVSLTDAQGRALTADAFHTNASSVVVAFEADEPDVSVQCGTTTSTVQCNASPFTLEALTDGEYAVSLTPTDASGNMGSTVSLEFTVDQLVPVVYFDNLAQTETVDAAFTFSNVRCAVEVNNGCNGTSLEDDECSLWQRSSSSSSSSSWSPVEAGASLEVAGATIGATYSVEFLAVDLAGNVGALEHAWERVEEVDVAAIVPTIVEAPAADTPIESYSFLVAVNTTQAAMLWQVNGGGFSAGGVEVVPGSDGQLLRIEGTDVRVKGEPDAAETGTNLFEVKYDGSAESTTYQWIVRHCADTDELEYVEADGSIACVGCRSGDSGCAKDRLVARGFWLAADAESDRQPYRCLVEDACPGQQFCLDHPSECSSEQCALGYDSGSVLCGVCADDYGETLDGSCSACGDTSAAGVTLALGSLLAILLLLVAGFVVKRSMDASGTARTVATLKIMANYFLMMSILKNFDLDWGSLLRTLFAWVGVASGGGMSDVQLVNCAFPVPVFREYLFFFLVPVLLIAMPGAAIAGATGWQRLQLWRAGKAQPKNVTVWGVKASFLYRQSLMVLSYFAYPIVVTASFRVLHCTTVSDQEWLVDDLSEPCSGSQYESYHGVALFFMCVLGPGVPLSIALYMRRYRHELHQHAKAQMQFFFFFGEFRPEWYWWEMTVMARKVVMGAISVLLSNDRQNMQVYSGTWLLLACFVAQLVCSPHLDAVQRRLEATALAAVLASLLLGQALAFQNLDPGLATFFRISVLVINVVVMNGMGVTLGNEILKEARKAAAEGSGGAFRRALSGRFTSARFGSTAGPGADVELPSMANPMAASGASASGAELVAAPAQVAARQSFVNPMLAAASGPPGSSSSGSSSARTDAVLASGIGRAPAVGGRGRGRGRQKSRKVLFTPDL